MFWKSGWRYHDRSIYISRLDVLELSAQPIGEKEEKFMPKKIISRDYPWPEEHKEPAWKRVIDKLQTPEELVFRAKTQPVTVPVSAKTMDMYKKYARKHHIPVEHMVGAVIDAYAHNTFSG